MKKYLYLGLVVGTIGLSAFTTVDARRGETELRDRGSELVHRSGSVELIHHGGRGAELIHRNGGMEIHHGGGGAELIHRNRGRR